MITIHYPFKFQSDTRTSFPCEHHSPSPRDFHRLCTDPVRTTSSSNPHHRPPPPSVAFHQEIATSAHIPAAHPLTTRFSSRYQDPSDHTTVTIHGEKLRKVKLNLDPIPLPINNPPTTTTHNSPKRKSHPMTLRRRN
ncbi:uncharacterized protein LOC143027643 [Oratosquilla oratoria]|uniref:uncharacterized protein LOC143027643 n=1 Tax=Oratosquilla oratoria TaxID=337810 RepID=UPI003F75AA88